MLYLDASVLVKCYSVENGTEAMIDRALKPDETLFTSIFTYAEVHAALARKNRQNELSSEEYGQLRNAFERDWQVLLNVIALDRKTMAEIPSLITSHPLKACDAVHLATAIWLRDNAVAGSGPVVFAAADRQLLSACEERGLQVFDPGKQASR